MKLRIHLNPDRETDGLDWRIETPDGERLVRSVLCMAPFYTEAERGAFYVVTDGMLEIVAGAAVIKPSHSS